jgi:hypothetical protein
MSMLITLIVALIVAGLLLWAITQLPIDPQITKIIRVVIIVAAVLYVLAAFTGNAALIHWRGLS